MKRIFITVTAIGLAIIFIIMFFQIITLMKQYKEISKEQTAQKAEVSIPSVIQAPEPTVTPSASPVSSEPPVETTPPIIDEETASVKEEELTVEPTPTLEPVKETPVIKPTPTVEPTPAPVPSIEPVVPSIITMDMPIEYTNNTIQYEYYEAVADTMLLYSENLGGAMPLKHAIETVSQVVLGQPLDSGVLRPNSIQLINNNIYIDFTSNIYNANFGTRGEGSMVESVADSYLNNVPGLAAVYISVDGTSYATGHMEFSKDLPYKVK